MQPYCCKQKSKAFPHLEAGEALLQLRQKSVDLFPMIVNSWVVKVAMMNSLSTRLTLLVSNDSHWVCSGHTLATS